MKKRKGDYNEPTTLAEIAKAMKVTKMTVKRLFDEQDWKYKEGARGQFIFQLNHLPTPVIHAVQAYRVAEAGKRLLGQADALKTHVVAEVEALQDKKEAIIEKMGIGQPINDKQRAIGHARLVVVHAVEALKERCGCTRDEALALMNAAHLKGELAPHLAAAMEQCLDKPARHGKSQLAPASLCRWAAQKDKHGHCYPELKRKPRAWDALPWLAGFLRHYQLPEKPTQETAYKAYKAELEQGGSALKLPHPSNVCRALAKMPKHILEQGRETGSTRKARLNFVRRDWDMLESNDVWVGDGHTFKAKVKHPDHGRAFAPEVTVIMDCRSRFIVGWAFSLSETQLAVSEAIGTAMTHYGVPLAYYSDNGSGQTAQSLDEASYGLFARFDIAHETGIPGNPQGRGIIERLWDVTTIAVAKQLKTYQGKDMDSETLRKVNNEILSYKTQGLTPDYVISWDEFIKRCEARFNWYNTEHPHRSLGGKTPIEVYRANLNPALHRALTDDEVKSLYRPSKERIPARGEVKLFNNIYYSRALLELPEKTKVRVAYDFTNPHETWVYGLDGRFICKAEWNGNKVDAFPKARVDQLKELRFKGIEKRNLDKIEAARQEVDGGVIEGEIIKKELPFTPREPAPERKEFVIKYEEVNDTRKDNEESWAEVFRVKRIQAEIKEQEKKQAELLAEQLKNQQEQPKNNAAGL